MDVQYTVPPPTSPRVTEWTPLLEPSPTTPIAVIPRQATQSTNEDPNSLPYVAAIAAQVQREDVSTFRVEDIYLPSLPTRAARSSLSLCALLHYRKSITGKSSSHGRDVWAQWREKDQRSSGARIVDALVLQVWANFLEDEGTTEELTEILWSTHLITPDSKLTVRVIDFLAAGEVPQDLQCHDLLNLSLIDAWQYGRHQIRGEEGAIATLRHFIDRQCGSPSRVLHFADCLIHAIYVLVLWHYLMWPQSPYEHTMSVLDTRRTIIMTYTLSRLVRPWSWDIIPPLLALFAFVITLPYAPVWHEFSYSVLLLAYYWQVLLLYLLATPTPLLLLRPDWILPLSVLAKRSAASVLSASVFFLLALLAYLFMFEIPLVVSSLFSAAVLAPMSAESVAAYSIPLAWILLGFVTGAMAWCMLMQPFLAALENPTPASEWDRYTVAVGIEARRAFAQAVATYGSPYYFPAQASLVQAALVRIPRLFLETLGKERTGARALATVERVLWRVVVGPVVFVLSGFWLWHLRSY
ncbi:hypothetical protein BN946_scf184977.g6 [Trametes cinnabarina]|uniref:Uncharacterized protein n=1 Tax=Pycnoporus cinnabarinus TaxID=5643 RepID=A0A060SJE4_PYCCI|nr:hypothetical protein BN946_scf184977.g6 [Trametes cinnabarina]